MYSTYKISLNQAEGIIQLSEGFLNDVKAKEIKPNKLSETVSAFANASGGDIYVGIAEDKKTKTKAWAGFSNVEDANAIAHVLIQAHELGNHLAFEFLECDGLQGLVLHITVRKVKEIVKSSSGDIFLRSVAGKIKIDTPEKLNRLKLDKGIVTFEDEWVEAPVGKIENSLSIINFLINVIPSAEPEVYLGNQELIKPNFVKVVGLLLFCDEPAVYIPKRCSVKIMRYRTDEEEIGREFLSGVPTTMEGDCYNLIYKSVEETKRIIEGVRRHGDDGTEEMGRRQFFSAQFLCIAA